MAGASPFETVPGDVIVGRPVVNFEGSPRNPQHAASSRLQFQRLPRLARRGGVARIAGAGYQGIELLADVPHAWPAGLLEEQKEAIRDGLVRTTAWRSPTSTPS